MVSNTQFLTLPASSYKHFCDCASTVKKSSYTYTGKPSDKEERESDVFTSCLYEEQTSVVNRGSGTSSNRAFISDGGQAAFTGSAG